MKQSYFIFYGSAVAYCISMLVALQVGNLSIISSVVQKSTVQKYRTDIINSFEYITANSSENPQYDRPGTNHFLAETSTSREWNKEVFRLKNNYYSGTDYSTFNYFALIHSSHSRILSFITSDQHHINPPSIETRTGKYQKSNVHLSVDSKSTKGFSDIIKFPDKLS